MGKVQEKVINDDTQVSTTELATVLGVTARRVQQLTQDGTFQTEKRGRYFLTDNVQRYITFITGNQMTPEEKKTEQDRRSAEAKMKTAKAAIALFEVDELRGNMHRSEDVMLITNDLVATIRGMLTALPGQLAVNVAQSSSAEECSAIIRDAVYAVMDELSRYQYDPTKYEELVRERRDWSSKNSQEDENDE